MLYSAKMDVLASKFLQWIEMIFTCTAIKVQYKN